jgi:16S rRNA (cytidine1402-2'-O)-methyltransferase
MPILYLIPNLLSESNIADVIPSGVVTVIRRIEHFFAEDIRTARRFLVKMKHPVPIDELHFYELNEHTREKEIASLLPSLLANDTGIISEAGVPGVADPGAVLVRLAHQHNIGVVPLTGPSSVLMALMASGLNGQSFAFNGYLPVKQNERIRRLQVLEKRSVAEQQTQIFIETPYRNMKLLEDILRTCRDSTSLCIAANITGTAELIKTKSIAEWKKSLPDLHKIPAVFLLQG